ncbi:MAG: hypothetical protein DRO23_02335 [Thermoprotei archaeon]|nr:MAG: hypothetical protein DRO23_02335 [Thermoprotei archaeon]
MYGNIEKAISKYYSKFLFKTPKHTILLLIYFLEILLYSLILFTRNYTFLASFPAMFISHLLLYLVLRGTIIAKINYHRRFLTLIIFITGLSLFIDMLLTVIFNIKTPFLISYIASSFILYILLIPENNVKALFGASLAIIAYYITSLMFLYGYLNLTMLSKTLILVFSSSLLCFFLAKAHYWSTNIVLKTNSILLARSFLELWFAHNPSYFERILKKFSETKSLWVKAYTIVKEGMLKGIILTSLIHSGPFRNAGSSKYISVLRNALEREFKVPTIILHTTTTHVNDLTSSIELEHVKNKVIKKIKEDAGVKIESIGLITCNVADGYGIFHIPFEHAPMFILFKSSNGIDDLPETLSRKIESYISKFGLKDVFIVEAHNSIPNELRFMEQEIEMFNKLIYSSINDNSRLLRKYPLEIGIGEAVDNNLLECPDLCSNKIQALAIKSGEKILALAIVDGNNALENFRKEVISKIKELGIEYVELITTDNHERTGMITGKHVYVPVGASPCRKHIIANTMLAIKNALSDLSKGSLYFYRIDLNLKTLGSKGLSLLNKIAYNIGKIVCLFLIQKFIAYIIPLLIIALIY